MVYLLLLVWVKINEKRTDKRRLSQQLLMNSIFFVNMTHCFLYFVFSIFLHNAYALRNHSGYIYYVQGLLDLPLSSVFTFSFCYLLDLHKIELLKIKEDQKCEYFPPHNQCFSLIHYCTNLSQWVQRKKKFPLSRW